MSGTLQCLSAMTAMHSGLARGPRPLNCTLCAGKLHFVKFETQRINDCIDFIEAKGLHRTHNGAGEPVGKVRVVATGGGAYKYADRFQVGLASCLRMLIKPNIYPRMYKTKGTFCGRPLITSDGELLV